ncbi:MAG: hypothetical protein QRY71_01375 [Candidatus Rhabdochlamydia sp.]
MHISFPPLSLDPHRIKTVLSNVSQKAIPLCLENWGTVASGILLSLTVVNLVDHYFHQQCERMIKNYYKSLSLEENQGINYLKPPQLQEGFRKRSYTLMAATFLTPAAITAVLWKVGKIQSIWNLFIPLMIGGVIGKRLFQLNQYYLGVTAQKMMDLIKEYFIYARHEEINLSHLQGYVAEVNFKRLNHYLREHRPEITSIALANCNLTDHDLKRLSQSGLLTGVTSIDLSDNPRLSYQGLKWVGMMAKDHLETLNISRLKLRDMDLHLMEKEGHFNAVKTVILDEAPLITGYGLATLGKEGFNGLEVLSFNKPSSCFKEGFKEWLNAPFPSLHTLYMNDSSLMEKELSQMLDDSQWFIKLKELSLHQTERLQVSSEMLEKLRVLETATLAITTVSKIKHHQWVN